MSSSMDEVDREFIRCLFPEYLLQQPVAYDLWSIYFQHKKLFNKIKHSSNSGLNGMLVESEGSDRRLQGRLSYSVRKEIWHKLMNLGVLGTLSFDSTTDEYLMQVYKYFYPASISGIAQARKFNATNTETLMDLQMEQEELEDVSKLPSLGEHFLRESSQPGSSRMQGTTGSSNGAENDDDDEDDDDEEDDDNDDDDEDDDEDNDDEGDDDVDIVIEDDSPANADGNSSSQTSNPETVNFYPALATQKFPTKSKKNMMVPDIYQMMGYFLPNQWTSQSNKSILLSGDGVSQLCPHPNWQAYLGYERSGTATRNRLRNSFSGSQKNDFATTWANNPLPLNKLGIYYYEIKVLSVTSSQGAQNSNIIVGYKQWSGSNPENASQGTDNDHSSSISSGTSGIGTGLRSSLRGRGTTEASIGNDEPSSSNKMGLEEGFLGYCGNDGSITAGSQYKSYSKSFGRDDVIGCGVNYVNGTIFFTKNGVCLGTAFTDFHDVTLVPYIALRSGNSVRTNFGLYEEFVFDIVGYQDSWKAKAYKHIFKSIDSNEVPGEFESDDEEAVIEAEGDVNMDVGEEKPSEAQDNFTVLQNSEYVDGQLVKPDVDKINTLNTGDESIPSTLHTMISDYLIHEGLIDVAKGFLKDLKKDMVHANDEGKGDMVIRHNERQIIKEEKNLKVRQDLRRFITSGNVTQCLEYLDSHLPGLLKDNIELLFELKLAQYLLTIKNFKDIQIGKIVQRGQELSKEFVYDEAIPQQLREKFRAQLSNVSALLAYEDPVNESTDELSAYLSNEYLQDRLFQIVNTSVLIFLHKNCECELENVIKYTRAMLGTLMNFDADGSVVHNGTELRCYKILNIDQDLLNL